MAQEDPRRMRSSTNHGSPGHEQSRSEAPMSGYNSNALTALRGLLKIKVVMEPHLIDMLEIPAGGFMTRAEALSVRNAESPMGQLIEILLSKGDEEFVIFCDMLRKSNHCHWAENLKQKAESLRTGDRKEETVEASGQTTSQLLAAAQGPDQALNGSSGAVAQTEVIPKGVAASPFSVPQFLATYEDKFLAVINPKLSLLKLKHKGVISADVRTDIESANDDDAKYILLEHLQKHATVDTLRVYCDVAIAANGFPRMQELGRKMMDALPPGELIRKGHRSSTQSSEDLEPQQSVAKKSLPDYMTHKMDLVAQDISDLHSESDPEVIIKLLYGNALSTISDLLGPHLKAVKKAAGRFCQIGVHRVAVDEDSIESANSIDRLMRRMFVGRMWDNTHFLRKAIASIPHSAPEQGVAEAILSHYHQHKAIFLKARILKDTLIKESKSEEEIEASTEGNKVVPVKITSTKAVDSFSCEDCHVLQERGLHKAYGIPEKIILSKVEDGNSTTVTFLIPSQYAHNVIQRSAKLDTVWILVEINVIEVSIPGVFTFIPSASCFLSLLRGSKSFTADLLGVAEVLPYQTYCLLDSDTKEPLSGRPLSSKRIEQPWDSHEESVSGTAGNEGAESTPEKDDGSIPPKLEEEAESEDERQMKEVTGNSELLSRVQDLESKLEDFEQEKMALLIKLKTCQEEEGRARQRLDESSIPPKLEEEAESEDERQMKEVTGNSELLSRVQDLECKLEDFEQEKMALLIKLKTCQEEEGRACQKILSLKKEMLFMRSSKSLITSDPLVGLLQEAAREGNQSLWQLLVKQFINVESKSGRTPLLLAAERGHTDLVKMITEQYEGDIFHKMKNSRNVLHVAACKGHLPVLQYLCPMFGDRLLDRDAYDERCLDIAQRLRQRPIVTFLTENYPQLEDKGGAGNDFALTAPSQGPSKRAPRRRWWLKVSAVSSDTSLIPFFPKKHAEGCGEIEGEVVFRRDARSKLMRAVSGTEWMYRRGALERGRRAATTAPHQRRLIRYHQRWLADNVLEEEEESFKQWWHELLGKEVCNVKLPNMPMRAASFAATIHNSKVYISAVGKDGKGKPVSPVLVYSINELKWNKLPEQQHRAVIAVLNNHITLIGGRDLSTEKVTNTLSTWYEEEGRWKQVLPPMPTGRFRPAVISHDNLLLVTGGVAEDNSVLNTTDILDLTTMKWTAPQGLSLPIPLWGPHLTLCGEYLYLMRGATAYPWQSPEVDNSKAWRAKWSDVKQTAAPQHSQLQKGAVWIRIADHPTLSPTPISCGGTLYTVGGRTRDDILISTVYSYIRNQWVSVGDMSVRRFRNCAVPLSSNTIFVAGGRVVNEGVESEGKWAYSSLTELLLL